MNLPSPPLLVISDRLQARRPLVEIAEAVFRGGCRWFSLREKDLPAAERRDLLRALAVLGHRFGATVTAHEDIAAVIAAEADGVHLPGGNDPAAARRRLPRGLIGVSALAAAARLSPGPVIALGGIDGTNVAACLAAGAWGIAVMGEVMRAADPEET